MTDQEKRIAIAFVKAMQDEGIHDSREMLRMFGVCARVTIQTQTNQGRDMADATQDVMGFIMEGLGFGEVHTSRIESDDGDDASTQYGPLQ